jgi:hypothetical protein
MSRRFLVLLALGLFSLPLNARGADFTLFVGGLTAGSVSTDLLLSPGSTVRDLSGGPVLGARLKTGWFPFLGVEHTLAVSPDFVFPEGGPFGDAPHGFIYSTNLILEPPGKKFVPYLTAGIGLIHQGGNPSGGVNVGTKLAVNFGGGLKILKVLGPMGLRFDVRDYNAQSPSWASSKVKFVEASAGVVFSF